VVVAVTRADVVDRLSAWSEADLRAVLDAAGIDPGPVEDRRGLADRVARQLWWHGSSPVGLALGVVTLDALVDDVARRARVDGALPPGDAWVRLEALTDLLTDGARGARFDGLDPATQRRLSRSPWATLGWMGGAGASGGAFAAGRAVTWVAATRVGRLLPYVPSIGPWVRRGYAAGGFAAVVGGPAAVLLGLIGANQALGPSYESLVPLLLGVGLLRPTRVVDVAEAAPI
jgi:hypothetical protein